MVRNVDMHVTTDKHIVLNRDITEARRMWHGKKFAAWSDNYTLTNRNV